MPPARDTVEKPGTARASAAAFVVEESEDEPVPAAKGAQKRSDDDLEPLPAAKGAQKRLALKVRKNLPGKKPRANQDRIFMSAQQFVRCPAGTAPRDELVAWSIAFRKTDELPQP
jgi:hypothetical protein